MPERPTEATTSTLALKGHQSFASPKNIDSNEKNSFVVQQKGVENDYINVLQEQIYFLELENNILKTTPSARPSGLGPKSPLDEVLLRLKDKYQEMQVSYKAQLQELDQQCRVLAEAKLQLEAEYTRTKTALAAHDEETKALKDEHARDAAQLVELNVQLQDRVASLEARNKRKEEAHESALRDTVRIRSFEREKRCAAEDALALEEKRRNQAEVDAI